LHFAKYKVQHIVGFLLLALLSVLVLSRSKKVWQIIQLSRSVSLLGADGWDAPELWELGGDALNGACISNRYSANDPSEPIQKFARAYRQRNGNLTPDAHAGGSGIRRAQISR
jgi:hypothetical protein